MFVYTKKTRLSVIVKYMNRNQLLVKVESWKEITYCNHSVDNLRTKFIYSTAQENHSVQSVVINLLPEIFEQTTHLKARLKEFSSQILFLSLRQEHVLQRLFFWRDPAQAPLQNSFIPFFLF